MIGYRAELLPDVCDIFADAERAGKLRTNQTHIAEACRLLSRGLTRVGIIGLVDEATGYQNDRAVDALAEILERFIAKELRPWIKTFPEDFYRELCRLRGLEFPMEQPNYPSYFGHLTNDIVYKRLAPGVLDELKKSTPKNEKGRHKHQLHRRLSAEMGHPKLLAHLDSVVTVMKLTPETDYDAFIEKLDHVKPRFGDTIQLPFRKPNN